MFMLSRVTHVMVELLAIVSEISRIDCSLLLILLFSNLTAKCIGFYSIELFHTRIKAYEWIMK